MQINFLMLSQKSGRKSFKTTILLITVWQTYSEYTLNLGSKSLSLRKYIFCYSKVEEQVTVKHMRYDAIFV